MSKKRILFLHPDLGIGGAERLVVDAALALQQKGFDVQFITSHHDKDHCFIETKDGTLPVKVIGDWLPRNIFGKLYAFCMYLRMIIISLYVVFFHKKPDLVILDLVSVPIPVLQVKGLKVLFYCHYPDQLLSHKGGFIKSFYRIPLDQLEEFTTCQADKILVNSEFTKNVVQNTFTSLKISPDVLYPSVNTDFFDRTRPESIDSVLDPLPKKDDIVFLSINRFERKKNLDLAIQSLHSLYSKLSTENGNQIKLVIAGGYDINNVENVEYFTELNQLAETLKLKDKIYFLKSPSDKAKLALFNYCRCVIYTPSNEHFGIVPIEAMYCRKPVIAVDSGGPRESIVNDETGFLCEPNAEDFASAMKKIVENDGNIVKRFSNHGFARFNEKFSFQAFANQLSTVVNEMLHIKKEQ